MKQALFLAVLLAVAGTGTSLERASLDDGMLDDLSVDEMQDSNMDDSLYHEDESHMSSGDVEHASKVFDTIFGKDDLGESAEASAQKALNKARKVRRKATKALMKATSVKATKK